MVKNALKEVMLVVRRIVRRWGDMAISANLSRIIRLKCTIIYMHFLTKTIMQFS